MSESEQPEPQAGGYSNISNDLLQSMIDQGSKLIDIRLPEEWLQTGVVPGSLLMTFFENNGTLNPAFLPLFTAEVNKDDSVILICRTGSRTIAASQAIAQQLGYTDVYNATGGIMSWLRDGRQVEQPKLT